VQELVHYKSSVSTGVGVLTNKVTDFLSKCHHTPLFLVGYSQGAQVAGDVYQDWLSEAARSRITGVVLFGDPKFWGPQGAPVALGFYSPWGYGVYTSLDVRGTTHRWPQSDFSKVRSYCVGGDPVCQFDGVSLGGCLFSCTHMEYATDRFPNGLTYTQHGAKFILSRIGWAPPPPAPSPSKPTPGPSSGGGGGGGGGGGSGSVPAGSIAETAGGVAHTWTNYATGSGSQGASIQSGQTVGVTCKVSGLAVSDGNTWWYRVASSPWSNAYYVSADAFYNNGQTSGSLHGTAFVDTRVPTCGGSAQPPSQPGTYSETTGGVARTWTDYVHAGGTQGTSIASNATVQIACKVTGLKVADGNTWWYRIASSPWNGAYYVSADAFYNNGATSGSLHGTPFVDAQVPTCEGSTPPPPPPPPPPTRTETVGGVTHTWTNYTNAGGTQGPSIQNGQSVEITCRLTGFRVQDGNTWWYQIGSSPWNNAYYASADAFYNNGQTSGSLSGTPFVDASVPTCGSGAPTFPETAGGLAHTWTNYTNAGGTQGPSVGANSTVLIACRLTGFKVADGNTWWYRIASAPWSGNYYVSADAFYNNGQTSGSLAGTPFVDNNVPTC
jgi:hypothetical protein